MALRLLAAAETWLVMECDEGFITEDDANHAIAALPDLFELFGDAAVALTSARNQWLQVADQRIERWFVPFPDTAPTGYLDVDVRSAPDRRQEAGPVRGGNAGGP